MPGLWVPCLNPFGRILTPSRQATPSASAQQMKESRILTKHEGTLVLCYFCSRVYRGNQLNYVSNSWMHRETVGFVLACALICQHPPALLCRGRVITMLGPCQYELSSNCALLRYELALLACFILLLPWGSGIPMSEFLWLCFRGPEMCCQCQKYKAWP